MSGQTISFLTILWLSDTEVVMSGMLYGGQFISSNKLLAILLSFLMDCS